MRVLPLAGICLHRKEKQMNNILTASRMVSLITCPRKHFWQYEIGLRKDTTDTALRFGSAWARAMESWRKGHKYKKALAIAIPEGIDLNQYDCATIAALLAAYYDYYGVATKAEKLAPEYEFGPVELGGDTGMVLRGKIDSLAIVTATGRGLIYEDKTTSDSVDIDSDYWLRLRFNMQILNYVVEARRLGVRVDAVIYNVVRKPGIKPKQVEDLDEDGNKIVVDASGERQRKKTGEPYQSANKEKGWVVKTHEETPDEYCNRLYEDVGSRPEFYFCRKEVPIIDEELAQFERQRLELAGIINYIRSQECLVPSKDSDIMQRDPDAWPRNVSSDTCNFCPYRSFCLQNLNINPAYPPQGFSLQEINPELTNTK
jgi:hypothetical protein